MSQSSEFFVQGIPRPKGSFRAVGRGNHSVLIPMSKELPSWEREIASVAKRYPSFMPNTPLRATLTFYMPAPKKKVRTYPTVPPDLDKLCRGVLDGLQLGLFLPDDKQVVELHAQKKYAHDATGVHIKLEVIDEPTEQANM